MKIKVYQINNERDENNVKFSGYDSLEKWQGSSDIDSSIYDTVFDGEIDTSSLNGVYEALNTRHPIDYLGHSLSVSDIVEVIEAPSIVGKIDREDGFSTTYTNFMEYTLAQEALRNADIEFEAHDYVGLNIHSVEPGFYFVDRVGFKNVEFESEKAAEISGLMKVVLIEPGKEARIANIGSSLPCMQRTVEGFIEQFCPFDDEVAIICNEEGKINGMALNRAIYDEDHNMVEIIAGTCFICAARADSDSFASLTDAECSKYVEMFRYPERFVRTLDGIKAITIKPSLDEKIAEGAAGVTDRHTLTPDSRHPERE